MDFEAIKDESAAHPVASAWRPTFQQIVSLLVRGDYELSRGVERVSPVSTDTASQIRASITDFGERLTDLSDETWETSLAQWMGTHWDVVIDLRTAESGASDLVLNARVYETSAVFRIDVGLVYVP